MTGRRHLRGRCAPLVLTTAMAATLAGCSSNDGWDDDYATDDTQICVGEDGYRVNDWQCEDDTFRSGYARSWYYVGRGSRMPYFGDRIDDPKLGFKGSRTAVAGVNYVRAPESMNMTRSAAKSRGGFGSSARSFGSGRS